ncbi:MAG TPA: type III pantothenate kinase, partial [Phycisphaerales bacterium]|nr:type III pantothenate kinase [Phycisphaerales bacterium]
MNIVAIDIGNTNITVGLFLDDAEKYIEKIEGCDSERLEAALVEAWEQVPFAKRAKVEKREGVIVVSSVNEQWTKMVSDMCKGVLGEKIKLIGVDVPLPIEMGVENVSEVGTDRVVAAAAAFAVVEDAVVVADFGTAVTIDLVDEDGVFLGGVICPGFELSAGALEKGTAKLPKVTVERPKNPVGGSTVEAINSGLYYSAIGTLRMMAETYAAELGKWPQLIVTGGSAEIIKQDCDFVDSWATNLV